MAVRTATEINTRLRDFFNEQTPEGFVDLLEDITDSVGGISQAQYDTAIAERDAAVVKARDMEQRYINRFYTDYNEPNSTGYVNSTAPQAALQQEEKKLSYDDLFE